MEDTLNWKDIKKMFNAHKTSIRNFFAVFNGSEKEKVLSLREIVEDSKLDMYQRLNLLMDHPEYKNLPSLDLALLATNHEVEKLFTIQKPSNLDAKYD